MDASKQYIFGKRWVLRNDPGFEDQYRAIHIDSGLSLNLSRSFYFLLKPFVSRRLSVNELSCFLERKGLDIELNRFVSVVDQYSSLSLLSADAGLAEDRFLGNKRNIETVSGSISIKSTPENAEIHLTHKCNLACRHCFQASSPKSGKFHEITKEKWIRIFNSLEYYNVYNIVLSGGEPLFYSEFDSLFEEIVNKRLRFNILTNGMNVNRRNRNLLCRPNVQLTISLDGYNADSHDFLRGKGAFDRVMSGIKLLLEDGARISLSYTVHRMNFNNIEDFIKMAIGMGVKNIGFLLIDPLGRAKENSFLLFSSEEMDEITKKIIRYKKIYGGKINIEYTDPMSLNVGIADSEIITCSAGTNRLAIDPDGILYPCAMAFGEKGLFIGDLNFDDLHSVWCDYAKWQPFRGGIQLKDIRECSECRLKKQCSLKNCRLKNYGAHKSLYERPAGCQYERQAIDNN